MAESTCLHCGATFEQVGRGRPRQWCYECLPAYSKADHVQYTRRAAALQSFKLTGRHASCCGIERKAIPEWATKAPRKLGWHGPFRLCRICQKQVQARQSVVCSDRECRRIYRNITEQEWRTTTDAGRKWKKRHTRTRRRITRVGDRDGWICHLCNRKVDQRLKFPHPLSPTVDHLIPRACGGSDEFVNLALAHFECNIAKGDKAAGEQLRLVG